MKNLITSPRVWEAVREKTGSSPIAILQRGNWPKNTFEVWFTKEGPPEMIHIGSVQKGRAIKSVG